MTTETIAPVDTPVAIVVTQRPNPLEDPVPAAERTDVVVYLSDTKGGEPIDSSLSKSAAETDTPGTYLCEFLGADLLNYLPERDGKRVYRCVQLGTHVIDSTPLVVTATL